MQFVGTFDYVLDERKRVPIPPAYRAAFEAGGFISTGSDPCLVLHTPESLQRAAAIIEAIPEESAEGEDARRDFYGNIWPIQRDLQGRVTLRDDLCEYAGIGVREDSTSREVTVVGVGRRMEIWDRATYAAREGARKAARRAVAGAIPASSPREG